MKKSKHKTPMAPNDSADFPIAGIGASAGGLEALEQLVTQLSVDTGMAFIVIQHLSPDHDSILAELITKKSDIPVVEVSDGMSVEKDHIYVIPPGMDMAILNRKLSLIARPPKGRPHMPIDYFLRSLADDLKEKAIGVILSGTATDGTLGLGAIKSAGGITFAQEPESARYDSMPRSAIAAGNVDLVLPPGKIAEELNKISLHPYLQVESPDSSKDLPDDDLNKIFILLRSATRVDFSSYKPATIHRRIARRMALHRIDTLSKYVRYLRENPPEVEALYQDMLIQVTSFFRDGKVFEALKTNVFPTLRQESSQHGVIRIWVPGCSSGEEAYSIAISLSEYMAEEKQTGAVQIFGTDLSETAIEKARAGIYPQAIAQQVSHERLSRFFTKIDSSYQINKNIRALCIFARQDLISDPPFSKIDMVSCRNVLIYLRRDLQKKVMPKFYYALKPNGFLLLGSSETVGGVDDCFKVVDKKFNLFAKKSIEGLPKSLMTAASTADKKSPTKTQAVQPEPFDLNKEVVRLLLSQFTPSSVVVNHNFDIIQSRGNTAHFLKLPEGPASLNLFKMARPGLGLELRAALHDAKEKRAPVQKKGIRLKYEKKQIVVDIEVVPVIPNPQSQELHCLIIFKEAAPTPAASAKADAHRTAPADADSTEQRRIEQLEKQLEESHLYLQSTIQEQERTNEQLRAASEEIQSSNEELQSTNEELETAKEELQSTNEELMTVNDELLTKNTDIQGANNDLQNLMASAQIPVLMVDNELRIRRFTAMAENLLGLIPSDIGRPLGDLKTKLIMADLESMIRQVIELLAVKELEVQDKNGHWWQMRIRPYKTQDHRIEGAVVSLMDIDVIKRSLEEVAGARQYAEAIVETIRQPLLVLDDQLRVKTANAAFYREFEVQADAAPGKFIYELADGRWDIPQLRKLLEHVLPSNTKFEDFSIDSEFPAVGRKQLILNARRVIGQDQNTQYILLAMEVIK